MYSIKWQYLKATHLINILKYNQKGNIVMYNIYCKGRSTLMKFLSLVLSLNHSIRY